MKEDYAFGFGLLVAFSIMLGPMMLAAEHLGFLFAPKLLWLGAVTVPAVIAMALLGGWQRILDPWRRWGSVAVVAAAWAATLWVSR